VRAQVALINAEPRRRTSRAGVALAKKIQRCAPSPDLEISNAAGKPFAVQVCITARASSRQSSLSKSIARK
jgi:hypothetical protein